MYEKDLYADDDSSDLGFMKNTRHGNQNNNRLGYQAQNQRKPNYGVEQDIQVVNGEDDDFAHHYSDNKTKANRRANDDEAPQQLSDIIGVSDSGFSNYGSNQGRLVNRTQTGTSQSGLGRNVDDILYDSGSKARGGYNNYGNPEPSLQVSEVYSINDPTETRPGTSSNRPTTSNSTSLNARQRLAEQQKARLTKQNTTTGTTSLVANEMLRPSKTGNMYGGSNIDYGQRGFGQSDFYDPTNKDQGKYNLPELSSQAVYIKHQVEEVEPSQSRHQFYNQGKIEYSTPQYESPPRQQYPQEREEEEPQYQPPKPIKTVPPTVKMEEPMTQSALSEAQDKESSDEEPTKEEMKALEEQKKRLNKQADAEIAVASPSDMPNAEISKILNIDTRDIPDMRTFLMTPCPKGYRIECTIKRDKSGLSRFYPKYHCYISNQLQYMMSSKKRGKNKTSNYTISFNKNEIKKSSPFNLGKVRSNFLGTEFNIFDNGLNPNKCRDIEKLRTNLGCALYESNLLSAKGPRKMRILLPEVHETTSEMYQFKPLSEKEGILNNFRVGKRVGIKEYFNKNPKWNEQLQAFVLNFNGRVEKPSVKNFQLIDERSDDRIYLQFGRITTDTFNMDFEWPLSPFQAFAICLSSFDYKIACE